VARILLVEDDADVREFLRFTLEELGHAVVAVDGGEAAMRALADDPVELVITDLFMPGKDGFEAILELRHHSPHLPVVAISGGIRGGSPAALRPLETARELGATEVLPKPFSRARLREVVERVLAPGDPASQA